MKNPLTLQLLRSMELAEIRNGGYGSEDPTQPFRSEFTLQPSMGWMGSMRSANSVIDAVGKIGNSRSATNCEIPLDLSAGPPTFSTFSIFHQEVEEVIQSEMPETKNWLSSLPGLFFQFAICFVFIAMNAYDVVFKKMAVESVKAGNADKIDNMTFVVFMGVVGSGLALLLTIRSGSMHILLTRETLKQFVKFTPVGVIVSSTQYLTFVILYLIDGDLFKVLQQTRLLGVAIIARITLRTQQSPAAWMLLVVTTLGAISFSGISSFADDTNMFYHIVRAQAHIFKASAIEHHVQSANVHELLEIHSDSQKSAVMDDLFRVPVCSTAHPQIKDFADMIDLHSSAEGGTEESDGRVLGIMLTFLYALADSFSAVYEQKLLKATLNTPFSIQVIYKLVPFTISACALKMAFGDAFARPGEPNMFRDGFFRGWENPWAVCAACAMLGKEWFQGVVIKHLDALVRQLCGIVTIVLLYFILRLHGVSTSPMSIPVIITILGVVFSVFAYALVGRAHKFSLALEEQLAEAKHALGEQQFGKRIG